MLLDGAMVVAMLSAVAASPPKNGAPPNNADILTACDGVPDVDEVVKSVATRLAKLGWHSRIVPGGAPSPLVLCSGASQVSVEAELNRARDLFYEPHLPSALAKLTRLLSFFQAARFLFDRPDIFLRTLFYLGWIEQTLDHPQVAQRQFRSILQFDPSWRPDPNEFSPEATKAFDRMKNASPAETADIDVVTVPAGGRVRLDARKECIAPCRLAGVVLGDHFLVATHPSYPLQVGHLEVRSPAPATVAVQFQDDVRRELYALLAAGRTAEAKNVLQQLDAGVVVLIDASAGAANANAIVAFPPAKRSISIESPLGKKSSLAAAVAAAIGPADQAALAAADNGSESAPGKRSPLAAVAAAAIGPPDQAALAAADNNRDRPPAVLTPRGAEKPSTGGPEMAGQQKTAGPQIGTGTLVLLAGGATLATVAVGAIFGYLALQHRNRADQYGSDWREQVREGQRDQNIANVSYGAATVSAAAGLTIWLLRGRGRQEVATIGPAVAPRAVGLAGYLRF
jgi:hypothetical protein